MSVKSRIEELLGKSRNRFNNDTVYVVADRILCKKCGKGKWHEDYRKQHGHWFEEYDKDDNRVYPQYPEEIEGGCYVCGGSGRLAHLMKCRGGCNKEIWHDHYPMTAYDGKIYNSFCGTELVYTSEHGSMCKECYDGGNRDKHQPNGNGKQ